MNRGRWRAFLLSPLFIAAAAVAHAQNAPVTITLDALANRHPIDPRVYGIAHADAATLNDLNVPLNRSGGNNTTRYNWLANADNRANDWYYESIAYPSAVAGEVGDTFISNTKSAGAAPMITIPMAGWVAKVGSNRSKLASFSIAKYGQQTGNDWQWFPDAGNGVWVGGAYVTGNDPNDANVAADSTFQKAWMDHIVARWGSASLGGLRYYILDNEPSIWHSTHRDIHPTGAMMQEVRDKVLDYAAKVKAADPSALVVAPEEWGWSGYTLSGYDQQWGGLHGWSNLPDRAAHGGWDYLPWLLDQLRAENARTGSRLVDVFTVHYYPQGGEFSNDVSSTMQQRRNRSTRSLWDPSYVDETWIADTVKLVPRLKGWVATYYLGTKVGITEYNWGAEGHINGATAQADVYGIFGREALDLAARWTTPAASTPTYKAMKMYRNYDGNKSVFGDTSVKAAAPNPDTVASFGAVRSSDGALTVMLISKYLSGSTPATVSLANFSSVGPAQVWQLTSANAINRLADVPVSGSSVVVNLPAQSVTLLVVPAGAGNQSPIARATATPSSGVAPLAVSFNGGTSSDPDGSIASWAWTFGDGGTASGAAVSHTYAASGAYTAQLTVTDNQGATGSTSAPISVSANTVAAPSNLTATVSGTSVTLRWQDNSANESGFYVERAPKGGAFARIATVGANAVTFVNSPVARGMYAYRVQAFNGATPSSYSNPVQVKIR